MPGLSVQQPRWGALALHQLPSHHPLPTGRDHDQAIVTPSTMSNARGAQRMSALSRTIYISTMPSGVMPELCVAIRRPGWPCLRR